MQGEELLKLFLTGLHETTGGPGMIDMTRTYPPRELIVCTRRAKTFLFQFPFDTTGFVPVDCHLLLNAGGCLDVY
jgi:hypothetical protein